jgi:hypothetical protein
MTQDEIIEMANKAYAIDDGKPLHPSALFHLEAFAKLVAEAAASKEREALEVELLKLKQGVAANSDYIQGRWDLIGEFQDIIRSRS